MSVAELLTAGAFLVLAAAHSALGESDILKPLFAAEWTVTTTPRWAMEKILRFAWHLTSITWVALALIVLDVAMLPVIGMTMLASAALIFVMLRGHLAWPIFLVGGLAAFHAETPLPEPLLLAGAIVAAVALAAAAVLHVWWAFGGTWGLDAASPTDPSRTSEFAPGRALTLLVAGLLVVAAAVISWVIGGAPEFVRWMAMAAAAVFTIRAIGDTRVAGFTKTIRGTTFSEADDRIFTPLCVFLALGTTGALLL
jgi:hypothetical protein